MFALYINHLGQHLKTSKYHCFANDTIYLQGNNVNKLVDTVIDEMENLTVRFAINKLKLNDKTKAMYDYNYLENQRLVCTMHLV